MVHTLQMDQGSQICITTAANGTQLLSAAAAAGRADGHPYHLLEMWAPRASHPMAPPPTAGTLPPHTNVPRYPGTTPVATHTLQTGFGGGHSHSRVGTQHRSGMEVPPGNVGHQTPGAGPRRGDSGIWVRGSRGGVAGRGEAGAGASFGEEVSGAAFESGLVRRATRAIRGATVLPGGHCAVMPRRGGGETLLPPLAPLCRQLAPRKVGAVAGVAGGTGPVVLEGAVPGGGGLLGGWSPPAWPWCPCRYRSW